MALPACRGQPVAAVGAGLGEAEFGEPIEAGGILRLARAAELAGEDQPVQSRAAAGFQVGLVPHGASL